MRLYAEQSEEQEGPWLLVLQAQFNPDRSSDWCLAYWNGNVYDPARAHEQ
jgi:hypothetical protein